MAPDDDPCMMAKTQSGKGGGKPMAKDREAERAELAETVALVNAVKKEDAREDEAWRVKTDKAAFGRKRIPVPDRWD